MKMINLQLFADDVEEIDEEQEELETEEEKEEEAEEKVETEEEEQEVSEEEKPDKKDKKTVAIIKTKQENKKLRDELAKYKQEEEERKTAAEKEKIKQKYVDNGFTEEEAQERAEEKSELSKIKKELKQLKYNSQAEKLSAKYPDIYDNLDRLIELSEKTGWSLEKVCRAELEESSEYDVRTKTEQAELIARQKKNKSKPAPGNQATLQSVKLEPEDERAYQTYLKFNPGVSRKQYKEKVLAVNNQKIPHDRWED